MRSNYSPEKGPENLRFRGLLVGVGKCSKKKSILNAIFLAQNNKYETVFAP